MSEVNKNEQLLHALIDGELNPSESRKVRAMLAADPELNGLFEQYRQQKESLAALPRFSLPNDFADRVMNAAVPPAQNASMPTAVPVVTKTGFSTWQIVATAILSSAATLMLSLFLNAGNTADRPTIAQKNARDFAVNAGIELETDLAAMPQPTGASPLASSSDETTLLTHSGEASFVEDSDEAALQPNFDAAVELDAADYAMRGDAPPAASSLAELMTESSADTTLKTAAAPAPAGDGAIEQVWLLEAQDDASQQALVKTLAANSIAFPMADPTEAANVEQLLDEEIDGILIEATSRQMRKALIELADSQKFEISAFPLPGHEAYSADIYKSQFSTQRDALDSSMADDATASAPAASGMTGYPSNAAIPQSATAGAPADPPPMAPQYPAGKPSEIGRLKLPARALAQQLRGRSFNKVAKVTPAVEMGAGDKTKSAASFGAVEWFAEADGPEGLGSSAAARAMESMAEPRSKEITANARVTPAAPVTRSAPSVARSKNSTKRKKDGNASTEPQTKSTQSVPQEPPVIKNEQPLTEQQNLQELFPQQKLKADRRGSYLLLIRTTPKTVRPRTTRPRTIRPRSVKP